MGLYAALKIQSVCRLRLVRNWMASLKQDGVSEFERGLGVRARGPSLEAYHEWLYNLFLDNKVGGQKASAKEPKVGKRASVLNKFMRRTSQGAGGKTRSLVGKIVHERMGKDQLGPVQVKTDTGLSFQLQIQHPSGQLGWQHQCPSCGRIVPSGPRTVVGTFEIHPHPCEPVDTEGYCDFCRVTPQSSGEHGSPAHTSALFDRAMEHEGADNGAHAKELFEEAARLGHPDALKRLAWLARSGGGEDEDDVSSISDAESSDDHGMQPPLDDAEEKAEGKNPEVMIPVLNMSAATASERNVRARSEEDEFNLQDMVADAAAVASAQRAPENDVPPRKRPVTGANESNLRRSPSRADYLLGAFKGHASTVSNLIAAQVEEGERQDSGPQTSPTTVVWLERHEPENGYQFFFDQVSGDSKWERPTSGWLQQGQDGNVYYVNLQTGESQWHSPLDDGPQAPSTSGPNSTSAKLLAPEWTTHFDSTHQKHYYVNVHTKESQWHPPPEGSAIHASLAPSSPSYPRVTTQ